uniref:Reverse transcriptase Ty1/copia-type domain-containing protein n=1 Tax=Solanum lycopersicum TaxID=4081 RepID=A0A3Q7G5E3_SOLLC
MTAATRVVRYLKKSPGLGIFLSSDCDSTLTAFCDADWASCPNTRRSVTGEAEYRSLASTVAEIVWLVGLFTALNVKIPLPTTSFHSKVTQLNSSNTNMRSWGPSRPPLNVVVGRLAMTMY